MTTQHSEGTWEGKHWITLGDSITAQDGRVYNGTETIARGYQTVVHETLNFGSIDNKGVSGRPMANGSVNGFGTNTTGKNVSYTESDLVTIAAGTNDFKLNVSLGSIGQIGDTEFDSDTFYGAYRDLVEYILSDNPAVRIVLFTPLQRDNDSYDVNYVNSAGHQLIDYVKAVQEIGGMYSLPVCDLYRNSGFTKKTLELFTLDGLHPNDFGYERMGKYAAKFLDSLGN